MEFYLIFQKDLLPWHFYDIKELRVYLGVKVS